MKSWQVASGRATFAVPGSFELDVSALSEDQSSPWFFVDLRLLFTPAPELPTNSRFFAELDRQLNMSLGQVGLSGTFDTVLNYVLTHKIAVLREQAVQLQRDEWAGCIRVEQIHRAFVVQYWPSLPGKKSWLEVNLARGEPRTGRPGQDRGLPRLIARWFREGVEIKDAALGFGWTNLDLEDMLRTVTSLHVHHLFETARRALGPHQGMAGFRWQMRLCARNPSRSALAASLGHATNRTRVTVESKSGKFVLHPTTNVSRATEYALNTNKDARADVGGRILSVLCSALQTQMRTAACKLRWILIGQKVRLEDLREATCIPGVRRYSMYQPEHWPCQWGVALLIGAHGVAWYIVELNPKDRSKMVAAERVDLDASRQADEIVDSSALRELASIAAADVSLRLARRTLERRKVVYRLPAPRDENARWELKVAAPALLGTKATRPGEAGDGVWSRCTIYISHADVEPADAKVFYIVRGQLGAQYADLYHRVPLPAESQLTLHPAGGFSVLVDAPFGASCIDAVTWTLRELDRLRILVDILERYKLGIVAATLQSIRFRYTAADWAVLSFNADGTATLDLDAGNPHHRIKAHLTVVLNEPGSAQSCERLVLLLLTTHPVLAALARFEAKTTAALGDGRAAPAVHGHGLAKYRLGYSFPACAFDIELRDAGDSMLWQVSERNRAAASRGALAPAAPARADAAGPGLDAVFAGHGRGWHGLHSSIVAGAAGVVDAVSRLHNAVVSAAGAGDARSLLDANSTAPGPGRPGAGLGVGPGRGPGRGPAPVRAGPAAVGAAGAPSAGAPPLAAGAAKNDVVTIDLSD